MVTKKKVTRPTAKEYKELESASAKQMSGYVAKDKGFTTGVKVNSSSTFVPGEAVHRGPKGKQVRVYAVKGVSGGKKNAHMVEILEDVFADISEHYTTRHVKNLTMETMAYKGVPGVRTTHIDVATGKKVSRSWLHKSAKGYTISAKK